jgi:hypothetical protein
MHKCNTNRPISVAHKISCMITAGDHAKYFYLHAKLSCSQRKHDEKKEKESETGDKQKI